MGQAFRRAAGRVRSSIPNTPSPSSAFQPKNSVESRMPAPPVDGVDVHQNPQSNSADGKAANVLEMKDPKFDAMLGQMAGRISTKQGGRLEMGEAAVVMKPSRPLPRERTISPDSGRYEEKPAPLGTLNVAQLRQIMLLYQGKAEDYNGRMDVQQIAERFRVDVSHVQNIVQSVSLPPEAERKRGNEEF